MKRGVQQLPTIQGIVTVDLPPRTASVVVAASDAPEESKALADYVCTGSNDQAQIQSAINGLPPAGGTVLLTEGTFNVTKAGAGPLPATPYCIIIDENHGPVALVGQPGATRIFLTAAQPASTAALLICGSNDGAGKRTEPTLVQGIEFDGNMANQGAFVDYGNLHMNYANHVTVDQCYVHDAKLIGIHVLRNSQYFRCLNSRIVVGANAGVRIEAPNSIVANNIFQGDNSLSQPALMTAVNNDISIAADYAVIANNLFVGGYFQFIFGGSSYGVIAQNTFRDSLAANAVSLGVVSSTNFEARENLICNNTFHNIRRGLRIYTANAGWGGTNNRVIHNSFMDGPGIELDYGINVDGADNEDNELLGNYIRSIGTAIQDTGTGTIIRQNTGYVTEKHGAAATVADGGTIAHGCATTPTVALVTPSVAGEMASVTGIGATNITVAIKKHDGTAGTSQTIYWRAYV